MPKRPTKPQRKKTAAAKPATEKAKNSQDVPTSIHMRYLVSLYGNVWVITCPTCRRAWVYPAGQLSLGATLHLLDHHSTHDVDDRVIPTLT